jgi:hypothetical protein
MAGENPNAKKLRENDKKNAGGPRSICADPEAFKHPEPKSKLHHSGKRK